MGTTEQDLKLQTGHRWYTRPVFFVADLDRALHFYVDALGFEKQWHSGDGAGTVCQVTRGECEIILCQHDARKDKARLFIELTPEGVVYRTFPRAATRQLPSTRPPRPYQTSS
jgi:catechol 2,3-dioxygenase-like lactoylglutathione lyase family enzyme